MSALSAGNVAYLGIGFSKQTVPVYPLEGVRVKERFPPLQERLKVATMAELFDVLGNGYTGWQSLWYPTNRDRIVIREILSRGRLQHQEIREVLLGRQGRLAGKPSTAEGFNQRLIAFLDVLRERDELAAYAPALEEVYSDEAFPAAADYVVGRLFATMKDNRVDFTNAAFSFLEHRRYSATCLFYLEFELKDEAGLRKLANIEVKPEFGEAKASAIGRIRSRLRAVEKK